MSDHKSVPTIPELLPCPFCGGTSAFVEREDFSSAYVQCDSMVDEHSCCMARGPLAGQDDDGEEIPGAAAAIAAWNKRAAPTVQGEPESSGLYAVYLRDNWDGEGDTYWILARKQDNGVWVSEESGKELIKYEGDALLKVVPLVAAPQPVEQQPFEWPLLDAPALIGGAVVGKGCSTGTVVAMAKRAYQYAVETSPEEHARREKAFKDMLRQIHEGIGQQPAEQRCEYCDGTGDVHSLDGEWRGTCDCPAGQQPEPISRNLRAVLAMILNALDRDAAEGKAVRGEMAAELRSALSEQQPSPDVAGLMGVLGQYFDAMDAIGREGTATSSLIAEAECDEAEARLRDLLAAHRKQGGEV